MQRWFRSKMSISSVSAPPLVSEISPPCPPSEFWHLRALIEETAHGVRAGQRKHKEELENVDSQNSLVSEVNEGQHLGLVFFDVLFLDGRSQLARPYCERREILESIVSIIPGQAILAERHLIDLKSTHELPEVCLARTFARCLAYHQEGLVLKSNSGNYGEDRNPWVKLKKDYIPGLGDCLDMILVGASWEKDRGHQLKGMRFSPFALSDRGHV